MALSYTVGNWSIVSTEVDSITVPKTLDNVPDLKYSTDYSVKSGSTSTDTKLINTTSPAVYACEEIAYGRQEIGNIYDASRFTVPNVERLATQQGIRIRVRIDELLSATNTVSGAEIKFPMEAWLNIDVPKNAVVTNTAVMWLFRRLLGACMSTNSSGWTMLMSLLRGDLDPTR